jgi:hypothetical protein
MKVKFYCDNHCGDFEKDEQELRETAQSFRYCPYCGLKLKIKNLEEIIEDDLYKRAEEYLNTWLNTLGIEGTIELINRNKDYSCSKIYIELLQKKGLKL